MMLEQFLDRDVAGLAHFLEALFSDD